jgi:beta-glucosidase
MTTELSFPPGFLWGVATSAYQIEGATREDGRGASIWDTFSATPGKIEDGSSGDIACDHYHRWEEDLELIKSLGVDSYRFSISWPRVLPEGTGKVNEKGLDFYERLVDGMLGRGLEPNATLYHWDLPQALQDRGGWGSRDTAHAFVDYADAVTKRLGDRVKLYATFNEPWCISILSHQIGEHAPGLQDLKLALQVAHHVLLAHGLALPVMRENAPEAEHGIVLNFTPGYAASDKEEDQRAAWLLDGSFNRWFADPVFKGTYPEDIWEAYGANVPEINEGDMETIRAPIDFLGVNYYTRAVFGQAPSNERTEMGWEVYPQGLKDLLLRLPRDYGSPVMYVTENGAAYPDRLEDSKVHDPKRISYYERHLEAVSEAIKEGADVRGYYAWSLMDNFEWAKGYTKRFGLVYVDYETQRRILKDSARWYRDFVARQRTASAGS